LNRHPARFARSFALPSHLETTYITNGEKGKKWFSEGADLPEPPEHWGSTRLSITSMHPDKIKGVQNE